MWPNTRSFHTKTHHNTVQPEVTEQFVKAWLGVTDHWETLHHNGYYWYKHTKVSSTWWRLQEKSSNLLWQRYTVGHMNVWNSHHVSVLQPCCLFVCFVLELHWNFKLYCLSLCFQNLSFQIGDAAYLRDTVVGLHVHVHLSMYTLCLRWVTQKCVQKMKTEKHPSIVTPQISLELHCYHWYHGFFSLKSCPYYMYNY